MEYTPFENYILANIELNLQILGGVLRSLA